jgi:hypothetical protein
MNGVTLLRRELYNGSRLVTRPMRRLRYDGPGRGVLSLLSTVGECRKDVGTRTRQKIMMSRVTTTRLFGTESDSVSFVLRLRPWR